MPKSEDKCELQLAVTVQYILICVLIVVSIISAASVDNLDFGNCCSDPIPSAYKKNQTIASIVKEDCIASLQAIRANYYAYGSSIKAMLVCSCVMLVMLAMFRLMLHIVRAPVLVTRLYKSMFATVFILLLMGFTIGLGMSAWPLHKLYNCDAIVGMGYGLQTTGIICCAVMFALHIFFSEINSTTNLRQQLCLPQKKRYSVMTTPKIPELSAETTTSEHSSYITALQQPNDEDGSGDSLQGLLGDKDA